MKEWREGETERKRLRTRENKNKKKTRERRDWACSVSILSRAQWKGMSVFSQRKRRREESEGGKRGRRRSVVFQRLGRQVAAPALCLPGPQDQQVTHPKQAHTPSHTHFKTGSLSHTHLKTGSLWGTDNKTNLVFIHTCWACEYIVFFKNQALPSFS